MQKKALKLLVTVGLILRISQTDTLRTKCVGTAPEEGLSGLPQSSANEQLCNLRYDIAFLSLTFKIWDNNRAYLKGLTKYMQRTIFGFNKHSVNVSCHCYYYDCYQHYNYACKFKQHLDGKTLPYLLFSPTTIP